MIFKKKRPLILILFFFVTINSVYGQYKAKNVFIVVGDQFRHDESFGDRTHKNVPHLWNDLIPKGSQIVTFYGNPAFMVLVHLAVITGSWADIRRLTPQDFPNKPTMFEYYRKHLKKPKESC